MIHPRNVICQIRRLPLTGLCKIKPILSELEMKSATDGIALVLQANQVAKSIMTKTTVALAIVLAIAAPWNCTTAQTAPDRYHQRLEPVLEKLIPQQQLPGFAIAVVEDNRVVYAAGFGVKNV